MAKTQKKQKTSVVKPSTNSRAKRSKAPRTGAVGKVRKNLNQHTKLLVMQGAHHDIRFRFLRRYGLIATLAVVVAVQGFFFAFQDGRVLGNENNLTINQLLADTNSQRSKNSLEPLILNDKLTAAAEKKAQDMLLNGYWSHDAPSGTTPWDWINGAGYKYSYAGENLARGFNTSAGVINAWMESPSHRSNVLGNQYTDVGFAAINGVLDGKQTTLIVAMYGRPVGAPLAGGNDGSYTLAAQTQDQVPIWTRMWRGIESMPTVLTITIIALIAIACAALLAHFYRTRIAKSKNKNYLPLAYRHHGLYKAGAAIITAIGTIFSSGGGMI